MYSVFKNEKANSFENILLVNLLKFKNPIELNVDATDFVKTKDNFYFKMNKLPEHDSKSLSLEDSRVKLLDSTTGVMKGHFDNNSKVDPKEEISLLINLFFQHENDLNKFLQNVQDISSNQYHNYITKSEFINNYSPDEKVYNELATFFTQNGFIVNKYPDRLALNLIGNFSQIEKIFHTEMKYYNIGEESFFAPATSLIVDCPYAIYIKGISGLNSRFHPHPFFQGSGGNQFIYGSDLQNAYQLTQLYSLAGYPIGKTIAIIGSSGYDTSGNPVGPYNPLDIDFYFSQVLPPDQQNFTPIVMADPITTFLGEPELPGSSAVLDLVNTPENTIDIEMAGSTAPGSNIVLVYGQAPLLSNNSAFITIWNQCLEEILFPQISNDTINLALNNTEIISLSAGYDQGYLEYNDSLWDSLSQTAAALGISILVASGDNNNVINLQPGVEVVRTPSFPSSASYDNYGSIAVGGTKTTLNGIESLNGTGTTTINDQTAWGTLGGYRGTQGGVSMIYDIPTWQETNLNSSLRIDSTGYQIARATPDIAGPATNIYYYLGGNWLNDQTGTSFAAPLIAGEVLSMNKYLAFNGLGPEGFFASDIYRLGQMQCNGSFEYPFITDYPPFFDVTSGSNRIFYAYPGYDLVTGWGSINAYNFLHDQIIDVTILNPSNESTINNYFYINVRGINYEYGIAQIFVYINDSEVGYSSDYSSSYTASLTYGTGQIDPNNYVDHGIYNITAVVIGVYGQASSSILVTLVHRSSGGGGGGGGGGGCIAKNTYILLANNNTRKVQSLHVDDWIMGYNLMTRQFNSVQITNISTSIVHSLLVINNGLLELTLTDQPIYMKNGSFEGWLINPGSLQEGDTIFDPTSDSWITITSLNIITGYFTVYDIRTSPLNNFIANGILLDSKT